jgi:hypothetical protein
MTQPQDPARRLKQKRRREKQLARWRASQPEKTEGAKAKGSRSTTPGAKPPDVPSSKAKA